MKKKHLILLVIILIISAFLRLYRISDYMTFLGDEGRDVLVVKGILEGDFTFLGPRSSAGDFYTGPIYYYMMAPFLWLFRLDPVGPSIMIALLGVATVYLIYHVGRKIFSTSVGLIAAALYTVSPLVLTYSRSSWNPNPMPFFTLLLLYLLYLAVQNKSWKYFLGVGILYGIALQLHYIELFVGVVIFFFVLFSFFYLKRKNIVFLIKQYLLILAGFIIGFSPFLAFELRHNFPNIKTILGFVLHGDPGATDLTNKTFVQIIQDVFFRVFAHTVWSFPSPDLAKTFDSNLLKGWSVLILLTAILSIYFLLRYKNKLAVALFAMWLGFGIVLFGFYKKPINDYNFEFLFPLPFLLTAYLLYLLFTNKKLGVVGKGLGTIIFLFLLGFNLYNVPFKKEPNRQMQQMRTISEFILSKTDNKPFNFALITGGNSDHAYRYFFSINKKEPVTIENEQVDPERNTVTDQLLIVCEDVSCQPLGHPLFEVAGFGRAEIAGEWNVSVVKVYKLIPYEK
jgi:4-amino-4-deoxy-L-arabinose transferase-like glycosyltransferase